MAALSLSVHSATTCNTVNTRGLQCRANLRPHLLHVEHEGVERLLDVRLFVLLVVPAGVLQPGLQLHLENTICWIFLENMI